MGYSLSRRHGEMIGARPRTPYSSSTVWVARQAMHVTGNETAPRAELSVYDVSHMSTHQAWE